MSVQYLTEAGDVDCNWVTLYDGPDSCCILFTTDSRVTDFTLLDLFAEDFTETGAVIFSATPVELDEERDSLPSVMTPDTPVAVQLIFPGDLTAYGISYVDAGGNLRRFAIEVSATTAPCCWRRRTHWRRSLFFRGRYPDSERNKDDSGAYKRKFEGGIQYEKNTIPCNFVDSFSLYFRLLSP